MTQPTRGFGSDTPIAFSASASASRIGPADASPGVEERALVTVIRLGSRLVLHGAVERAGFAAAHDEEILRDEGAVDVGVFGRMRDVRIDRIAAADRAADAMRVGTGADRPAAGDQRRPSGPATVGARHDDAMPGDEALAGVVPAIEALRRCRRVD